MAAAASQMQSLHAFGPLSSVDKEKEFVDFLILGKKDSHDIGVMSKKDIGYLGPSDSTSFSFGYFQKQRGMEENSHGIVGLRLNTINFPLNPHSQASR